LREKIKKPNCIYRKAVQSNFIQKSACKMLMKLTPTVNFTNILEAAFVLLCQNITNPNFKNINILKNTFYEKAARKILVKSTTTGSTISLTKWCNAMENGKEGDILFYHHLC